MLQVLCGADSPPVVGQSQGYQVGTLLLAQVLVLNITSDTKAHLHTV